tara:strand:- start:1494 stop:1982 length:489 start_codon:yes stop_codon:yes gene_type:complete
MYKAVLKPVFSILYFNLNIFIMKNIKDTFLNLFLRLVTGGMMFYYHGFDKITAGTDRWDRLGGRLSELIGLDFLSTPLGFMASFSESIVALFIMIGLFTRPSAFLLLFTMLIASLSNIITKGIDGSELSLIYLFLTLIIFIKGSDRFSLDSVLFSGKNIHSN